MDGLDFNAAISRHTGGLDRAVIRSSLEALAKSGVVYFRDGGDNLGACIYARSVAHEYGIRYATPAFAIHKEGRYGDNVGRSYSTIADFQKLVLQAQKDGADFIKLMMSGIMTFKAHGELSCPSLPADEIAGLVRIAHDQGLKVMAHVNGSETIKAALAAGTDSIEHGYFMDGQCIDLLVQTKAVWVPTLAPVAVFAGFATKRGAVAGDILKMQMDSIRRAFAGGAYVASGSDSGAHGVPHGGGILAELRDGRGPVPAAGRRGKRKGQRDVCAAPLCVKVSKFNCAISLCPSAFGWTISNDRPPATGLMLNFIMFS
jgi:hypothetical protein